jgi:hypothetical protein
MFVQASTSTSEPVHGEPAAPPAQQPAPNAPTPPPGPADIADWRDAPCLLRLKPVPGQRVAPPADPSRIPLNTVHLLTALPGSSMPRTAPLQKPHDVYWCGCMKLLDIAVF